MGLKLIFGVESTNRGRPVFYEGDDASDLVEKWINDPTGWYTGFSPAAFQESIIAAFDLPLEAPCDDEALLDELVAADRRNQGSPLHQGLQLEETPDSVGSALRGGLPQ